MKLTYRFALIIILGVSAFIALVIFKTFTMEYFTERNAIELQINSIETTQQKLDYQILHNTFFLYTNQDAVNAQINQIRQQIKYLIQHPHIIQEYPKTRFMLKQYSKVFEHKVNAIYDFQTTNTVIKNSTSAIPLLQARVLELMNTSNPKERQLLQTMNHISGTILLGKNALDLDLITALNPDIEELSRYHFNDKAKEELAQRVISNFQVIEYYFSHYLQLMDEINNPISQTTLQQIKKIYLNESKHELRLIILFSYFLMGLYLLSLGIIIYFLFRSEKESRTDTLTGLQNRKAYEERINHSLNDLGLILINISKFKHYNDFYGVSEGDKLLIETARHIRTMPFSGANPAYYRLGADDFGILFEQTSAYSLEALAKEVLSVFSETPIIINNEIRSPSIVVAASAYLPLLETADMALKSNSHNNPIIYHEGLNLRQVIQDNVTKVKELKDALQAKRIVPYFQPIVDLSTCTVTKHEVLARIIMNDTEVHSIFPYLSIAKESNLYSQITHTIIAQSLAVIAEHSGEFSINLSIEDINSSETVAMIERALKQYENLGNRIIFEILESEAVEEYEGIARFIEKMHRYGCRIAIDDFGSGYSNFSRILNLTIDIIKIDGSLIHYLDTDNKAITIVQTIVNFTKNASIETVAEFVHNKAIANIVSELGIDYAQGFYFYEPAPHPVVASPL